MTETGARAEGHPVSAAGSRSHQVASGVGRGEPCCRRPRESQSWGLTATRSGPAFKQPGLQGGVPDGDPGDPARERAGAWAVPTQISARAARFAGKAPRQARAWTSLRCLPSEQTIGRMPPGGRAAAQARKPDLEIPVLPEEQKHSGDTRTRAPPRVHGPSPTPRNTIFASCP